MTRLYRPKIHQRGQTRNLKTPPSRRGLRPDRHLPLRQGSARCGVETRRIRTQLSFHPLVQRILLKERVKEEAASWRRSGRNQDRSREGSGVTRVSWLLPSNRLLLGRAVGTSPGFLGAQQQTLIRTRSCRLERPPHAPNHSRLLNRLHESPATFARARRLDSWIGPFSRRARRP